MDKLIFIQVAVYLPYNATFYWLEETSENVFRQDGKGSVPMALMPDNIQYLVDNNGRSVKLGLRPLSDFSTNPPAEFIMEFGRWLRKNVAMGLVEYYHNIAKFNVDTWPRGLVEIFIKHHFDVFGLIKKGLALDIHTIK
jgi:hypothetical protein